MNDLLTALVRNDVISEQEAEDVASQAQSGDASVEQLVRKHGVSKKAILEAKGSDRVPHRTLDDDFQVPFETLQYIPEESAKHYQIVPLAVSDGVLEVGVVDPDNIEAFDALNFISSRNNMPYKTFLISEEDFERVLTMYQGLGGTVGEALSELETESRGDTRPVTDQTDERAATKSLEADLDSAETGAASPQAAIKEDAPVTKIVATILRYAIEGSASDVHIEPMSDKVRVRFRVDGVLRTSLTLPPTVLPRVVARVKILASLRLDETRKPQDGRFSATVEGRQIDFRVSTFPTQEGEKVVLRILDPEKGVKRLENTGLSERDIAIVRRAIKAPYGIILISGPTGSGKSTTLYAMLHELDRGQKNVLSLEDPIEYNIEGVSQSQVRPEIDYTFANGLRSTLRQDPDIIMVGEIRDGETARLAIQAALTGHLVLSTIHTNDALGVIPRLVDMGIDPYLIAPTLQVAMAQRLVKKLCDGAAEPKPVEGSVQMMLEQQFSDLPEEYRQDLPPFENVHEATPTSKCPNGTRGRTGVFEILEMNDEIERIILENPNKTKIWDNARAHGMLTMKEDAIIKSLQGTVPFSEVNALGGMMQM